MDSRAGSESRTPRPTRTAQVKHNPALQALVDYGYPEKQSRAFLESSDAERLHELLIQHKRAPAEHTAGLPPSYQHLHIPGRSSNTNWVLFDPLSTNAARNPELHKLLSDVGSKDAYISITELRRLPLHAFVPDIAHRTASGKYLEYNTSSHAIRMVSISRLGDLEVIYTDEGPRLAAPR